MRYIQIRIIALIIVMLFAVSVSLAQAADVCTAVTDAITADLSDACRGVPIGWLCMAHPANSASAYGSITYTDELGYTLPFNELGTFSGSPADASTGDWGVGYGRLPLYPPRDNGVYDDTQPSATVLFSGDFVVSDVVADEVVESFSFTSHASSSDCGENLDGMLISMPEDAEIPLEITINGVLLIIEPGAGVFITADPDGVMTISVLAGDVSIDDRDATMPIVIPEDVSLAYDDFPLTTSFEIELFGYEVTAGDELAPEDAVDVSTFTGGPTMINYALTHIADHIPDETAANTTTPLSGAWQSTPMAFEFIGCESPDSIQNAMDVVQERELTFGEEYDWRAYIESVSQSELPPEMLLSNPATDRYNYVLLNEYVQVYIEMRIISETEMVSLYYGDGSPRDDTCQIAALTQFIKID